jgi:hypothetical protein
MAGINTTPDGSTAMTNPLMNNDQGVESKQYQDGSTEVKDTWQNC